MASRMLDLVFVILGQFRELLSLFKKDIEGLFNGLELPRAIPCI
jgi:hypothetical protein